MIFKPFLKKNIFNNLDVILLRKYFQSKEIFNESIKLTDLNDENLLINYIFSKKINQLITSNIEKDFYFINTFVIQKNNRTLKKEKYHKDSGKKHQSDIITKNKNLYGKIGIMLQDNIKGEGGGIDYLKPMLFDNFSDSNPIKNKIRALYYILQDKLTDTHYHSKAGDVVYFSAMLSHRTSLTKKEKLNLIQDKYVIYSQITNLNTIKDVLKITRNKKEDVSLAEINKHTIFKKINDIEIKILDEKISIELGKYIGL